MFRIKHPVIVACLWAFLVYFLVRDNHAAEGADAKLIDHLMNIWKAQRSEIKTATITFRMVSTTAPIAITRDHVNDLLAKVDFVKRPSDIDIALRTLGIWHSEQPARFTEAVYNTEGLKFRQDQYLGGAHTYTLAFDGFHLIRVQPAQKHVHVEQPKGHSHESVVGLESLRYLPRISGNKIHVTEAATGRIKLTKGATEVIADPRTGFAYYGISGSKADRTEIFQYEPVTYPGGIVFPKLMIRVRYSSVAGPHLLIAVIDHATFNLAMPESSFEVGADAGWGLYDFRKSREDPDYVGVKARVENVLSAISSAPAR